MGNKIEDLEFNKLKTEAHKLLLDIEHDVSQREHWAEQRRYWNRAFYVAIFAMILTFSGSIYKDYSKANHSHDLNKKHATDGLKTRLKNDN